MRFATLRPGPALAQVRPEHEGRQAEMVKQPSVVDRRRRVRIGDQVAAQAVAGTCSSLLGTPRCL